MGRGQWGEGFSGTTIKDRWTKPRGLEAGDGWGVGVVVVGSKCRQLYMNNSKINLKKKKLE